MLDEEHVLVEPDVVHNRFNTVQEHDAAGWVLVDEALDHLRKDADRVWGVVLIAWDEGNPPDREGGETVPRTHFLRVPRRNAKARSPLFHNGLEEQVARFGLFPPNEVACPLFQSERFVEHWAVVLDLTEHRAVVLGLCLHSGVPYGSVEMLVARFRLAAPLSSLGVIVASIGQPNGRTEGRRARGKIFDSCVSE